MMHFGEIRSALHASGVDAQALSSALYRVPEGDPAWAYVRGALARRTDGRLGWVWSREPLDHAEGVLLLYDFQIFDWVLPCDSIHAEPSRSFSHMTHLTKVRRWGRVTLIDAALEADEVLRAVSCQMCLQWLDHLGVRTQTVRRALRARLAFSRGQGSRTQYKRTYAAFQEYHRSVDLWDRVLTVVDDVLSAPTHRAAWRVMRAWSDYELDTPPIVANMHEAHARFVQALDGLR